MANKKSSNMLGNESIAITTAVSTALMTTLFLVLGNIGQGKLDDAEHVITPAADYSSSPTTDTTTKLVDSDDAHLLAQPQPVVKPASIASEQTENHASVPVVEPTPIEPRPGSNRTAENMRLDLPELKFEANFPAGSSQDPAYRSIMEKISGYRDRLKIDSLEQKADMDNNDIPFNAWEVDIDFAEIQRTDKIVSAMGREYSYTGGAHPNLNWQGIIANANSGEKIPLYDFFMPRVGLSPALAIAACEKIKEAKIERMGEATIYDDAIECASSAMKDRIYNAETSLTSSTINGKFGGVVLMFAPYELGPYVEGPYIVVIDQEIFRDDLRPEYRDMFEGHAVRPQAE